MPLILDAVIIPRSHPPFGNAREEEDCSDAPSAAGSGGPGKGSTPHPARRRRMTLSTYQWGPRSTKGRMEANRFAPVEGTARQKAGAKKGDEMKDK